NVVVHWISFGHAPRGIRMPDARYVMESHHSLNTRQARGHHLRTAAESGKEVRLNETCGDFEIGVDPVGVQQDPDAGAGVANVSERSVVASIVANESPTGGNHPSKVS